MILLSFGILFKNINFKLFLDLHATYFPIFTNNYMLDESISVLGLSEMLDTQEKMNEESGYQPQADPTPMDTQVSYSYH